MMKKWYFSDSGKVSGPLTSSDVEALLLKGGDLYGWNPSLNHWLPVSKIPEFQEFLPEGEEDEQVSKELIDKFVAKKKDLHKKIALIDDSIEQTLIHLKAFETEINSYKRLTENLTPEVQENILPLEKKYNGIKKHLGELEKAADIAKQEIADVVREFGDLVLSKTSADDENMTSEVSTVKNIKSSVKSSTVRPSIQPARNGVDKQDELTLKSTESLIKTKAGAGFTKVTKVEEKVDTSQKVAVKQTEPERKSFSDVKNKLKSVFGNKEQPTIKLSDQLKMLEKNTSEKVPDEQLKAVSIDEDDLEEELVYIDSDLEEGDDLDDSEPKKKRRRRRR